MYSYVIESRVIADPPVLCAVHWAAARRARRCLSTEDPPPTLEAQDSFVVGPDIGTDPGAPPRMRSKLGKERGVLRLVQQPPMTEAPSIGDGFEETDLESRLARSRYHRRKYHLAKSSRAWKKQSKTVFVMLTFLLASFLLLGGLTIVEVRTREVTKRLAAQLVDLDRELIKSVLGKYQAYSQEVVDELSANSVFLDPPISYNLRPLEKLDDFSATYRQAKRNIDRLSLISGKYRRYRDAYEHVVAYASDAWVPCATTTMPPKDDAEHLELDEYDDANESLIVAIRTTGEDIELTLSILAVMSSIVAVTLFIVFTCVWHKAVHESEKAEEAERKTEAAVRVRDALIDGIGCAGVPGFIIDENSEVVDVNPAVINTFGFAKDELIGRDINSILVSGNRLPDTPRTTSRGKQVEGRHKGGKQIQLVCHTTRTVDVDGKERYLLVCQDITELIHKHDELEIQKKVLSQFTHELRNKYTPAASMLERIFQSISSKHAVELKSELETIQDDIRLSVALLHEADQLIATRLELHKVYHGGYVSEPNVQTVELQSLMKSRVEAAAALARNDVKFVAEKPDGFAVAEIFVRLDMYMFCHISNKCVLFQSPSAAHDALAAYSPTRGSTLSTGACGFNSSTKKPASCTSPSSTAAEAFPTRSRDDSSRKRSARPTSAASAWDWCVSFFSQSPSPDETAGLVSPLCEGDRRKRLAGTHQGVFARGLDRRHRVSVLPAGEDSSSQRSLRLGERSRRISVARPAVSDERLRRRGQLAHPKVDHIKAQGGGARCPSSRLAISRARDGRIDPSTHTRNLKRAKLDDHRRSKPRLVRRAAARQRSHHRTQARRLSRHHHLGQRRRHYRRGTPATRS